MTNDPTMIAPGRGGREQRVSREEAPSAGRCATPGASCVTPRASSAAFTLLEVLLAVAVFSIVLVAIHGVFYGALRLRNRTADSMSRAVPLQQALLILKRDLANLVAPGGTLFGELQMTPTTSGQQTQNQSQAVSSQSQMIPGYSAFNSASMKGVVVSPTFYTAVGIIDDTAPWGEVERVLYYLAEPTNNTVGKDLIRSVTRNLLPTLQDDPVDQWLMGGVQDVAFTFFDGNQWLPTWDSTMVTSNKLPQAIKVEVLLMAEETERTVREPITLVVPVLVQTGSNQVTQTQSTGGAP